VSCEHPRDQRIVQEANETFYERVGCLACNTWLEKPQLRERRIENWQWLQRDRPLGAYHVRRTGEDKTVLVTPDALTAVKLTNLCPGLGWYAVWVRMPKEKK
jgi:hypothetical protein